MSYQPNTDDSNDHTYSLPHQPVRTFDLRTSEERLVMWCAHLEMVQEEQNKRITHLELTVHRLLNTEEVAA